MILKTTFNESLRLVGHSWPQSFEIKHCSNHILTDWFITLRNTFWSNIFSNILLPSLRKNIFGGNNCLQLREGLKNKTFSLWERFFSFRNWKNKTCFYTSDLYRKLRNWKYKTYSSQKIRNWKNKTFLSRLMFYSFNF